MVQQSQLAVYIPAKLHKRLKVLAAKSGTSMAKLVEEAITGLLQKKGG